MFDVGEFFYIQLIVLGTKSWSKFEFGENEKVPPPRCGHTAIAYGTNMILFGGADRLYVVISLSLELSDHYPSNSCRSSCYNDLWIFDTLSQKWTEVEVRISRLVLSDPVRLMQPLLLNDMDTLLPL